MNNTFISTAAAVVLFGSSFIAEAALIYGAKASTSVADCPSYCTNFNFGTGLGGEGTVSTGISSVSESRGNARASAALTGGYSTPVLKTEAYANPANHGAFATAFSVQGYTYNGPGETLTLNVNLSGLVNDPEMDEWDTRVYMEIVLYESDPFDFYSDRGTLDYEVMATPMIQPDGSEASVQLQLDYTNPTNASGQISVDVATGEEFYLYAFMYAMAESGVNGTSVDAFNTGTMSFQGNPNLTAASNPVPVPAAVWLFGSGMVALLGFRRRQDGSLLS